LRSVLEMYKQITNRELHYSMFNQMLLQLIERGKLEMGLEKIICVCLVVSVCEEKTGNRWDKEPLDANQSYGESTPNHRRSTVKSVRIIFLRKVDPWSAGRPQNVCIVLLAANASL